MTAPSDMDCLLWGLGEAVSRWYRRAPGRVWELDFVRGLHEQAALSQLAVWIGQETGKTVRLQSIWMDKHAWVSWDAPDKGPRREQRELADLAVVVRHRSAGSLRVWMWIAQAKRIGRAFESYSGTSSRHEIELLHGMPNFQLKGVADGFELIKDFPPGTSLPQVAGWPPVSVPWTFLDFDAAPTAPKSAMNGLGSPIVARWTANKPQSGTWAANSGFGGAAAMSYAQCLASLVSAASMPPWMHKNQSSGCVVYPGAPVHESYPQWSRLYHELMGQARKRPNSGHAKSGRNEEGSVLQRSSEFLSFVHEYRLWPEFGAGEAQLMRWWPDFPFLRHYLGQYRGTLVSGCALSEPYSESLGASISDFDGESGEDLQKYSDDRDGGDTGGVGGDGPSDDGPGGAAVTLIVDVLGESPNVVSD